MRKWWGLLAGVGLVVAGCGGGGAGPAAGGPVGPGVDRGVPTINLADTASVSVVFLSGLTPGVPDTPMPPAEGDQIAVFQFIQFQNGDADYIPSTDHANIVPISVNLSGFTMQSRDFGVAVPAGTTSRLFIEFPFEVAKMQELATDADGRLIPQDLTITSPAVRASIPFDAEVRVFRGRTSAVNVLVDNIALNHSATDGVVFDEDRFVVLNYNPFENAITSFLSDYVAFDISGLPAASRPVLSATGEPADRVLFSGDGIAVSAGMGDASSFELLDPIAIKSGTIYTGPIIQGQRASNTYVLNRRSPGAPDPDAPDADPTTVVAITGVWRDYQTVITPTIEFNAVAFPKSDDGPNQQFVVFSQSGGRITALWQGAITFQVGDDATQGTFVIFPVGTVDDASPAGEVRGTVTNFVTVSGAVRVGDLSFNAPLPPGFPFPSTGSFVVFRR